MKRLTTKYKIELTGREILDLATAMATADNNQMEFLNCRDKRVRKLFRKDFDRRHKLWIKISHIMD